MYTETREEIEIDLRQVFAALWHRARLIGVATVLCGALAWIGSFLFITPQYRSSVTFYASSCDVDSAIVLLETGQTLDAVIQDAGLECSREKLTKTLTAKPVRETDFFRVTVTWKDAQEAKRIAEVITEILPQRTSEMIEGAVLRVVDPAVAEEKPSVPNYVRNTLIGALLGLAVTAGPIALGEIFGGGQQGRFASERKRGNQPSRRR